MKKLLLFLLMALTALPAQALTLYAVNVGKGDALLLRTSDGHAALIDAGKAKAWERLEAALDDLGVDALDAVILTHTDKDHAGGLSKLAKSNLSVGAWYASARYTGVKAKKHPIVKAAKKRNAEAHWLERGDTLQLGNATLTVLMPSETFTDTDDNNSLVIMVESPEGRILLTGDMEQPEEDVLTAFDDDLACDVLKIAHHAENDSTSAAFLQAAGARVGIISTDPAEKPGTPDPEVLKRMAQCGTEAYCTTDCRRWIEVSLTKDGIAVNME